MTEPYQVGVQGGRLEAGALMMRRKPRVYGPRPATKHVRKNVTLPDGTVLRDFPVLVADPLEDNFAENKAQPGFVDEHGQVPKRGPGSADLHRLPAPLDIGAGVADAMTCLAQWLRLILLGAYRLERYKLTLYGQTYGMPRIRGESLVAWRARMMTRLRSYGPVLR